MLAFCFPDSDASLSAWCLLWAMPLCALAGVVLDQLLGEARRWHPLVGFGRLAQTLADRFHPPGQPARRAQRVTGMTLWALLVVLPVLLTVWLLQQLPLPLALPAHAALLYFALGARSLTEHGQAIAAPLQAGKLDEARAQLSRIVTRNTAGLDTEGVAAGAVESLLENGNDAIFATLFWFALLGGPGAMLYRLANTLDAMWGYRTPRWLHFGWAAARLDDLLNGLPARLTALTYALFGHTRLALHCWQTQAPRWDSPNAGPVMAAGAGSLNVSLGGPAEYHGLREDRPVLGCGPRPQAADIGRTIRLLQAGLWFWLAALSVWALILTLTLRSL